MVTWTLTKQDLRNTCFLSVYAIVMRHTRDFRSDWSTHKEKKAKFKQITKAIQLAERGETK